MSNYYRLSRPRAKSWANVLVHSNAPQYRRMVEMAKSGKHDEREFRWDDRGIWVVLRWFEEPADFAALVGQER